MFSPDGVHLASGTKGRVVSIWSVGTGQVISTFLHAASTDFRLGQKLLVTGIDYSSDGSILVSAGAGAIELWDTNTWLNIGYARVGMSSINLQTGIRGLPVEDVSINTSGDLIATAGSDIHIWSVPLMQAMKIAETINEASAPETKKRKVFVEKYGFKLSETQRDLIENVSPTVAGELEAEFDRLIERSGVLIDIGLNQILEEWSTLYTSSPTTRISVLSEPLLTIPGDWNLCETIAFSPDDTILMATTRDGVGSQSPGSIRLWDLERNKYGEDNDTSLGLPQLGDQEFKLVGHTTPVYDGIFSPDGKTVASYGGKQLLKIWEATGNGLVDSILNKTSAFLSQVGKLSMSSDGSLLAVPLLPNVYIIDIASRCTIGILKPGVDKSSLEEKQDAQTLLEALPKPERGTILSTAFSPDGTHIATGQSNGTIKIWDLDTGQSVTNLQIEKEQPLLPQTLASYNLLLSYSPDGAYIASAGKGTSAVHLFDVESGEEVGRLSLFNAHLVDKLIKDTELAKLRVRAMGEARDLAFSPNGDYLALAFPYGSFLGITENYDIGYLEFENGVYIWDMETMEPLATFNKLNNTTNHINAIAWSPNGEDFAVADQYGVIKVWDLQNDELIWAAAEHDGLVYDLEYSADGQRLASVGEDKTINIWSSFNGELLTTLRGHKQGVESVVFSPDNSLLVSSGGSDPVRFWDSRPRGEVALEHRLVLESMYEMTPVVSEWFDRAGGDKELVVAMLDRASTTRSPYEVSALRNLVMRRMYGRSVDIDAAIATLSSDEQKDLFELLDTIPSMTVFQLQSFVRLLKAKEMELPEDQKHLYDAIMYRITDLIDAKRNLTPN